MVLKKVTKKQELLLKKAFSIKDPYFLENTEKKVIALEIVLLKLAQYPDNFKITSQDLRLELKRAGVID